MTCLLCLESTNNIIKSKLCSCKFPLHDNCFDMIKTNGLACPICRLKINKQSIDWNYIYFPEYLFFTYPNIFTFILFVLWTYIITIFCIIPYLIIICTFTVAKHYYNHNIRHQINS